MPSWLLIPFTIISYSFLAFGVLKGMTGMIQNEDKDERTWCFMVFISMVFVIVTLSLHIK